MELRLALHGEQGLEHTHAEFNDLQHSIKNVRKPMDNLFCLMKEHHVRTTPNVFVQMPPVKRRRKLFE